MSHGAVLRGDDLVLRHDAQGGVVVAHAIGAREETEHLASLDHARAGIGGVRPHRRRDRRPHRRQHTVAIGRNLDTDRLLARVNVGQEGLATAGDELDGATEPQGHRAGGHVVLIDVNLDAEAAADIGGDDAETVLGEVEELGEHRLHHVRNLR